MSNRRKDETKETNNRLVFTKSSYTKACHNKILGSNIYNAKRAVHERYKV